MFPFLYEAFYQSCELETFQVGVIEVRVFGVKLLLAHNDCIVYRDGSVRMWSQVGLAAGARFLYENPFRSRIKTLS